MRDALDDHLRSALGPLRRAPVPPPPALRAAPERARLPVGLLAAGVMIGILLGALFLHPRRSDDAARLRAQVASLEERISRVEHGELRALLGRELAILRRELELASPPSP